MLREGAIMKGALQVRVCGHQGFLRLDPKPGRRV